MLSLFRIFYWFVGKKDTWKQLRPTPGFPASTANIPSYSATWSILPESAFDDIKLDGLIELERSLHPEASLETLMEAAITRWERDRVSRTH